MEIVLAILLLFGGITLGSITADKGDEDSESTMVIPSTDGAPGSHSATQTMREDDPTQCHSAKNVIYRDLTVPNHGQIERTVAEVSDCEGKCSDE